MPTTAPIFEEAVAETAQAQRPAPPAESVAPDRVQRLESEMTELRETIARFAELMIGEVKDLRKSHAELPAMPGALGELPLNSMGGASDAASIAQASVRRPWLLTELLRDFGTTARMYFDPRYRVRRATQLLVPLILALFVINYAFFHYVFAVPVLDTVLEKIVDILLAILLYKIVSRELVRYRQVLVQLLAWQKYQPKHTVVVVGSEPAMTTLETE